MTRFENPGDFEDYMEMMEALRDDWMMDHPELTPDMLAPPHCFMAVEEGFIIVGEALDSPEEQRRKGYIYGEWFSLLCPGGELGYRHRSRIVKEISPTAFEKARQSLMRREGA